MSIKRVKMLWTMYIPNGPSGSEDKSAVATSSSDEKSC